MIYGQRIKEIRILRKLSQLYMAKKMNISQQAYSKYENNAGDKSLNALYRIAALLDVDIFIIITPEIPINFNTINIKIKEKVLQSIHSWIG